MTLHSQCHCQRILKIGIPVRVPKKYPPKQKKKKKKKKKATKKKSQKESKSIIVYKIKLPYCILKATLAQELRK